MTICIAHDNPTCTYLLARLVSRTRTLINIYPRHVSSFIFLLLRFLLTFLFYSSYATHLKKKSIILSKRLKFHENAHAISLTRDERIISVSSFFFFFFLLVGSQERCIVEQGENLEYFSISLQTYGFLLCKAWRKSKNFHN